MRVASGPASTANGRAVVPAARASPPATGRRGEAPRCARASLRRRRARPAPIRAPPADPGVARWRCGAQSLARVRPWWHEHDYPRRRAKEAPGGALGREVRRPGDAQPQRRASHSRRVCVGATCAAPCGARARPPGRSQAWPPLRASGRLGTARTRPQPGTASEQRHAASPAGEWSSRNGADEAPARRGTNVDMAPAARAPPDKPPPAKT
jgi:hypothetical protein